MAARCRPNRARIPSANTQRLDGRAAPSLESRKTQGADTARRDPAEALRPAAARTFPAFGKVHADAVQLCTFVTSCPALRSRKSQAQSGVGRLSQSEA